jgi:hypothetical protein
MKHLCTFWTPKPCFLLTVAVWACVTDEYHLSHVRLLVTYLYVYSTHVVDCFGGVMMMFSGGDGNCFGGGRV